MIVLDTDPLMASAADVLEMNLDLTIIGGRIGCDRSVAQKKSNRLAYDSRACADPVGF